MAEQSVASQLQDFVHHMASQLVETPDEVAVSAEQRGSVVQIDLRVPARDLGKVIGREGRIARSMRTLVMVAASRHNVRTNLDIDSHAEVSAEDDAES